MRTPLTPPPQALVLPVLLAALLTSAAPPGAFAQGGDPDPWATLRAVRESLTAAGPTVADFVQTYIPAGFSSGEEESGQVSIALPDCLRWDYQEPYPKVFLLCGETAHYWNPEDRTGRRFEVDRKEEPGLDLVLLAIDDLRGRYRVEAGDAADGQAGEEAIRLVPSQDTPHLSEAALVVDRESHRVTELSYTDEEGNVTRFEIRGYHPLPGRQIFAPPEGIEWREGEDDGG